KLHCFVATARSEQFAVGAECDIRDFGSVSVERRDRSSGIDIPEPNGIIIAAGGDRSSIWSERYRAHQTEVTFERSEHSSCVDVPELHRLVDAPGGDEFSVRTECHSSDVRCVTVKRSHHSGAAEVPKLDRAIRAGCRK